MLLASPQTSVFRDVTSTGLPSCASVSESGIGDGRGWEVSMCIAEQCLSLLHSLHFSVAWQSLARWFGEQHFKQRLWSFRMFLRSNNVLILKALHLARGWVILWTGQYRSRSASLGLVSVAALNSVLYTDTVLFSLCLNRIFSLLL